MRTGFSNLAIGKWIPVAFNQIAPKDADGKPIITQAITDDDRKLITDALMKQCDALDGLADGMISDPLGCHFDPAILACSQGKSESCLSPEKSPRLKRLSADQRVRRASRFTPASCMTRASPPAGPSGGSSFREPGIFGPPTTAIELDVEKEALTDIEPLVESMSSTSQLFPHMAAS